MALYDNEWQKYRRLRKQALFGFVGFLPLILVALALRRLDIFTPFLVLFIYILLVFTAWVRLNFFLCPHCRRLFAITWWYSLSIFAQKCVHCGLRKFSDGESLNSE